MIGLRPFSALGEADHGWLHARYHFSFSGYNDPKRMHWGSIRVWNDDEIAAKSGFPPHPHDNMEIITYVRTGAISHEDSLGNKGVTRAGDVQVMSAGTGIRHSEFNLEDEMCTLFQIWVFPDKHGHQPSWGTRPFPKSERAGAFVTLASGFDHDADALKINTPARLLGATLLSGQSAAYVPQASINGQPRHIYMVVAKGRVTINGIELGPRDGAAIKDEAELRFEALEEAEIVLLDAA
jgi:hypothetical protein